jgi:ABC-type methionine transport system ATPase subunit
LECPPSLSITFQAEIVLLDDVLSALDVHTSRWIVDNCILGSLLYGRTIVLVTHNLAMTSNISKNIIKIASDGRIFQCETIAEALSGSPELLASAAVDNEALEKAGGVIDDPPKADGDRPSGKLTADEEIALGHVSAIASEYMLLGLVL